MTDRIRLSKAAAFAFLTLMATQSPADSNEETTEKCYGVARAGLNDCATVKASCASSAKVDSQGDAFLLVPKGLCDRLAGGSLKPK